MFPLITSCISDSLDSGNRKLFYEPVMYRNRARFSEPVIYSKPNANRFLTSFLLWFIYATIFLRLPRKSSIKYKSRTLGRCLLCLKCWRGLKTKHLSFGSTTWCHLHIMNSSCGVQVQLHFGMWNHRSLNRNQTHVPCLARQIVNQQINREVPQRAVLTELVGCPWQDWCQLKGSNHPCNPWE